MHPRRRWEFPLRTYNGKRISLPSISNRITVLLVVDVAVVIRVVVCNTVKNSNQ